MKDKDFELATDADFQRATEVMEKLINNETFDKDDLHSAFIAGFDFEDSFETWYEKFIKNGTG